MTTESNVTELDEYRAIEDVVKRRLGATQVVFGAILESGEFLTYVPHEILDIDLVYLIQTFKDRRRMRNETET